MNTGYAIIPMKEYLEEQKEYDMLRKECAENAQYIQALSEENARLIETIQHLKIELEKN